MTKEQFLTAIKKYLVELLNGERELGPHGICFYIAERFKEDGSSQNVKCYYLGCEFKNKFFNDWENVNYDFRNGRFTSDRKDFAKLLIEKIDKNSFEDVFVDDTTCYRAI